MKSLLLPVLLAGGCVANESLTIERFVPALVENECVVSPTQLEQVQQGLLDVGLVSSSAAPGYIAFPVVKNQLAPSTSSVETRAITLKGFNVELVPDATTAPAIPTAQRKFFVPLAGGRLNPGGSVAVGVEVIPRPLAISLAGAVPVGVGALLPTVSARVTPVGDFGGDTINGPTIDFGVQICKFCLSGSPTACPSGGFPMSSVLAGGCIPTQDVTVTCCLAAQSQLLCGDAVPMQTM